MTVHHSNLDLVNINVYTKFGQILSILSKDIEHKNDILISIKSRNSVTNLRKMAVNNPNRSNPNLYLVNINVYTNFGQIVSICSQDIERKRNGNGIRQ